MAQKEPGEHGPSLELPSLGFGRRRRRASERQPEPVQQPARGPQPAPEPRAGFEPPPERRHRPRPPAVGGMTAAVVTGAVVGALIVGLTWASLRLCEFVQGTSSCGRPGFFLLLAIMLAMVLLGQLLLRALGVGDPGSTSLLGVGLVAVFALLFLVDVLFDRWMIAVIPVVGVAAFALSHWVTTTFAGPEPGDTRHR